MRRAAMGALSCVWAVMVGAALGQDSAPPPEDGGLVDPLVAKQEMIRDRVERLEDRMFRLREKLLSDEPENAARLGDAIETAGELGIDARFTELLALLRQGSRLDSATDIQEGLITDLSSLLKTLTEKKLTDEEARKKEIERLEQLHARISELTERQSTLRGDTGDASDDRDRSAQVADAIRRLDAILEKQEALRQATQGNQGGDAQASESLSGDQQALSQQTGGLADDVGKMGGANQGESDGDQGADGQGEATPPSGDGAKEASDALHDAQDRMDQAQKALDEPDPRKAAEKQDQAIDELRRARHRLKELQKELGEGRDSQSLADRQKDLSQDAKSLSEGMKKSDQEDGSQGGKPQEGQPQGGQQPGGQQQGGQQQGGQQQGEQQQGGQQPQGGEQQGGQQPQPPTPGEKQVQRAQKHMDDASRDLDEEKPRDATEDQDQALSELKDALAELDEALRQLRQEEQEEVLRDLEGMFRLILEGQLKVNAGTVELDATGRDNFRRPEELRAAELADTQSGLEHDVKKALHVLEEEGTTVVFPSVLEQLADDMKTVSSRLEELNVGPLTQSIEEQIAATLQDLVDAIVKRQQEMQQGKAQQGQPGNPDEQPLLPTSAELKLLRSMQVRIHDRTGAIDKERDAGVETAASLDAATTTAAERQKEAAKIAVEMRKVEQGS